MKKLFNLSHLSAGFTAVLVGYTSSVVIIIQAATSASATPSQIESWLLALGVTMGLTSIAYSWFYKTPILTAWSTPGAAMLVIASQQYELPVVIGSFVVSGVLILLTGLISPLSRALERIPSQLGTAMLGAILLPFCLGSFQAVSSAPITFLIMFAGFLLAKNTIPRYAMLVLLILGVVCAVAVEDATLNIEELSIAQPMWVTPGLDLGAILNLSIPLYIITMLSQNLPGIAMMKSYQYDTPVKPILMGTGITNILSAPFGGFSVNLAAISAAICMTPEVDSDKTQRYRAVIWAGVFYLIAGVFATTVVAIFLSLPDEVTKILAGFALLGTLMMCLQSAFHDEGYRESALFTFLITLSGISFLGVSATLWGLLVGIMHLRLTHKAVRA
ncbi:benzoate/H(+) symporter BenE family transporter [Vibrio natriegens]|uniref:Benzoate transporter n=1 Tax=Vibrio natriegens NBRC 15636 = ATCC 14048 = DSM 759 TaxID=1219067 RepID=A0AAN0Y1P0_VIBNA|nr:benzoate/H(+) symporter BenE family transporter [Vibrio natriegens]ALR15933.1 benzoate transporter [Vibrio natriegens NBRC 15636 = ATCC 14048 = DSM 759]ANQ12206.1 benzoate transporter [Vibrio natriegens NBRC 15636 = ATCC 14048 = DSM 759]EPM42687.1 benzoate transporter [Vibrio natriegens NBRC 15636 = ATCC 14048 = DSM 759]MDX6026577.1 benzoate/H(+) symporter BenE family transporter [Vibrio natriegens NBRC 15636 = ATCC 14048 = DSM 759]UUI12669.1 benzoate/H(+) symporter BenE family transporter 